MYFDPWAPWDQRFKAPYWKERPMVLAQSKVNLLYHTMPRYATLRHAMLHRHLTERCHTNTGTLSLPMGIWLILNALNANMQWVALIRGHAGLALLLKWGLIPRPPPYSCAPSFLLIIRDCISNQAFHEWGALKSFPSLLLFHLIQGEHAMCCQSELNGIAKNGTAMNKFSFMQHPVINIGMINGRLA